MPSGEGGKHMEQLVKKFYQEELDSLYQSLIFQEALSRASMEVVNKIDNKKASLPKFLRSFYFSITYDKYEKAYRNMNNAYDECIALEGKIESLKNDLIQYHSMNYDVQKKEFYEMI